MIDQHDHQADTTPEDRALLAGAAQLDHVLRHPFTIGFLTVAGAAILFRLGVSIGETLYSSFEGERFMATVFAATFVGALVAIAGTGAWLDRRRRTRNTGAAPFNDEQRHPLH